MSVADLRISQLTDAQFEQISALVKKRCGINLHEGKKELVKARLSKRLRALGLRSFQDYLEFVDSDPGGGELTTMLDSLSTNLTHFFREGKHFDHLRQVVIPRALKRNADARRLRIWSAGCSSGEEPYSLAVTMLEQGQALRGWDVKILATDLSTRVLAQAAEGVYDEARFRDTPRPILSKYFHCVQTSPLRKYSVNPEVRRLVTFGHLNLMERWPMKGPFDCIFCRNVMIYFEKPTQAELVRRYFDILAPGGTLFIGHSESLTGVKHGYRYVEPTVYEKP
jgi:chemotaxis protein methyltransferase CheR